MPGFRVQQIDHVELYVPDVYEAAKWYERTLGLVILGRHERWVGEDATGPLMISSDEGDTKLALFRGEAQGRHALVGHRRVAFRVRADDFLRFREHVATHPVHDPDLGQVTVVEPVDHGEAFSVYFCDPWGNLLEVTTYDADAVRARLETD